MSETCVCGHERSFHAALRGHCVAPGDGSGRCTCNRFRLATSTARPIPGLLDCDAAGVWYLRDVEALIGSRGLACAFIMGRLTRVEKHWQLSNIEITSSTHLAMLSGTRWCTLAGPYIGPTFDEAKQLAQPHMARVRNLFELP